jgi:hypothetical protein
MRLPPLKDQYGATGFGFALALMGGGLALCAAVFSIAFAVESRNCGYAGDQYNLPSHYDVLAGCYVTLPSGRSVHLDKYRTVVE